MLRRLHLVLGLLGILVFVLTGQYMHWVHDHLYGMADGPRLMFRSSHIYLLYLSLLNLLLGTYLVALPSGLARKLQWLASIALLLAPGPMVWSFLFESTSPELVRPMARLGIFLSFAGVLLHWLCRLFGKPER